MRCVVLVPGILGSVLKKGTKQVWPPKLYEYVTGYGRLKDLLVEKLTPAGLIQNVSFYGVYESLIDDIVRCGYTEGGNEKRLVQFPYDWRRSNRDTAETLADVLDEQHEQKPGVRFTLIGHSMGGLVIRYLLESGNFADRAWFDRVSDLITLGTPHLGAPKAIERLLGRESVMGLSPAQVARLGNDSRYPSLYELIPPAQSALTRRTARRGAIPRAVDPFSDTIAKKLGMKKTSIASARAFHEGLDISRKPKKADYFFFGSATHKTAVRTDWNGQRMKMMERDESGDGTVPIASSIAVDVPHGFSAKKHENIFTDRELRRYLYEFLGAPANVRPQSADSSEVGKGDAIGLSVDKETYAVGEPIEIAVSYNTGAASRNEVLEIVALDPRTGAEIPGGATVTARFRGADVLGFSTSFDLKLGAGLYEVQPTTPLDDPARTMFFVREDKP